ncbi:hypothetical protein LPJ68_004699 [Coemansia sp. RSA 1086]|nr:hypothetical protein LPJ68_004699 [Coemansia sp. RSA 1086]
MANYSSIYSFYAVEYKNDNDIYESEKCTGRDKDELLANILEHGMLISNFCVFATEADETTHYRTFDEAFENYNESVTAIIGFRAIITTFNVMVEIDDTSNSSPTEVDTFVNNSVYLLTARLLENESLFLELRKQLQNRYPEYEDQDDGFIRDELQKFCAISCKTREWLEEADIIEDVVDFANNDVNDPAEGSASGDEAKVTHLMILVPGTGPQSEEDKPKGSFTKKAIKFRTMFQEICQKEFAHLKAHVEMVSILYHADIHRLETAKTRMDKVTLPSIPWIRTIDNERIGDIMYYYSTFHGHEILKMVIEKLNRVYDEFIQKHPGFDGPVSLVAHSMGGLLCYEILYMMNMLEQGKQAGGSWEAVRYRDLPLLKFTPQQLFTMGSPHGGSLVFRRLYFSEYLMSPSIKFHNIFHPYDPFGYRTEPLVDERYVDIPAVPITRLEESRPTSLGNSSQQQHPPFYQHKHKHKSLGGSVADIGKTFVGAVMVVPVALSSTVFKVAKTSVTVPINAVTKRNYQSGRISSFLGLSQSSDKLSETNNPIHQKRNRSKSFGRLLRPLSLGDKRSWSFTSRHAKSSYHSDSNAQTNGDIGKSHMDSFSSEMSSKESESQDEKLEAYSMPQHRRQAESNKESSIDAQSSQLQSPVPHIQTVQSNGNSSNSSDGENDTSASEETVGDQMDDMLISDLVHVFSLTRPPGRDQQLAEAQGLPLSSRIMTLKHASKPIARTESPTLQQEAQHSATSIYNADIQRIKRWEPVGARQLIEHGDKTTVRRANTLPLTLADGRRMARAIAGGNSPPIAKEASRDSEVHDLQIPEPELLTDGQSLSGSVTPSVPDEEPSASDLPYSDRMDYIVPFTKRHLQNEYWLGLQAHFSYWTSRDIVYHILLHTLNQPQ